MAWNASDGVKAAKIDEKRRPAIGIGLIAGLFVVLVVVAWFVCSMRSTAPSIKDDEIVASEPIAGAILEKDVVSAPDSIAFSVKKEREFARELDDRIKPFITKRMTNAVEILGYKPLDPNDPDNAMRSRVAKDIGTLLSFPPGEAIPDIIPLFCVLGGDGTDGGNKAFLESLNKWQITIKESDSKEIAESKRDIFDAQLELIDGLDKGLTVNDSLRAAYEYRVRAAQYRSSLIEMVRELSSESSDINDAVEMIKKANTMLDENGFIRIQMDDVFTNEELESPAFDKYYANNPAEENK